MTETLVSKYSSLEEIEKKSLNSFKSYFLQTGRIYIGTTEDGYDHSDMTRTFAVFLKDLNAVKVSTYIKEWEIYESVIEVNPLLYKADTVEEAWKQIEPVIDETIGIRLEFSLNEDDLAKLEENDFSSVYETLRFTTEKDFNTYKNYKYLD